MSACGSTPLAGSDPERKLLLAEFETFAPREAPLQLTEHARVAGVEV